MHASTVQLCDENQWKIAGIRVTYKSLYYTFRVKFHALNHESALSMAELSRRLMENSLLIFFQQHIFPWDVMEQPGCIEASQDTLFLPHLAVHANSTDRTSIHIHQSFIVSLSFPPRVRRSGIIKRWECLSRKLVRSRTVSCLWL